MFNNSSQAGERFQSSIAGDPLQAQKTSNPLDNEHMRLIRLRGLCCSSLKQLIATHASLMGSPRQKCRVIFVMAPILMLV